MCTKVKVVVRCSFEQRKQLKLEAAKLNISLNSYLLDRGLNDKLVIDFEVQSQLAKIYAELFKLNQHLCTQESVEAVQEAIAACRNAGLELMKLCGEMNHAD